MEESFEDFIRRIAGEQGWTEGTILKMLVEVVDDQATDTRLALRAGVLQRADGVWE